MTASSPTSAVRRRKVGTYLMLAFMIGWIVTMIGMQFAIGVQKGFGTGFGDGGRVPPDVVAQAGVGERAADVVAATSHNAPPMSAGEEALRILFSIGVLLAIIYFWYQVMSRIGTF